jgi:hypothetical protein
LNIQEKPLVFVKDSSCRDCCGTTEDGSVICTVQPQTPITPATAGKNVKSLWQKVRGGTMLTIACIASPCCSVLLVPVILTLLAGTPVAVWIAQHLGVVYGGLTLLSIVSFGLVFHWYRPKQNKEK